MHFMVPARPWFLCNAYRVAVSCLGDEKGDGMIVAQCVFPSAIVSNASFRCRRELHWLGDHQVNIDALLDGPAFACVRSSGAVS
jgi:hypothetical protein